jgi:hypothetical protein
MTYLFHFWYLYREMKICVYLKLYMRKCVVCLFIDDKTRNTPCPSNRENMQIVLIFLQCNST